MKRIQERNRMICAFVMYARLRIADGCFDRLSIYRRIDGICGNNKALAADLWAVHEMLLLLSINGDEETLTVVKEIYLNPFGKRTDMKIKKSDVSNIILRFATENYMDVRTVYRRLQKAKKLWGVLRNRFVIECKTI